MRTTLSLDEDVAVLLEKAKQQDGTNMKTVVNTALRKGLEYLLHPKKPSHKKFKTRVVDLGHCKLASLDDISEVLALTEGEDFR